MTTCRPRRSMVLPLVALGVASFLAIWFGGTFSSRTSAPPVEPEAHAVSVGSRSRPDREDRSAGKSGMDLHDPREAVDVSGDPRPDTLRVRIRSFDGSSVPGALVQALPRGTSPESRPTIVTSSEGECSIPRAELERIVVSAAGHETVSLAPPPESVPLLEVVLGPGGFLAGFTREAGSNLPVRARIVAWPSGQGPPPADLVERGLRGDKGVAFTESGEDGTFRFEGLHPDLRYTVMAASPASAERAVIALPAPIASQVPGSEGLYLDLVPLFGLEVRLREGMGAGLATGARLRPHHLNPIQPLGVDGARYVFQPSYALDLVGLLGAPRYGDRGRHVYLFTTPVDRPAIGPLDWTLHPTGCNAMEAAFWAPPVTEHLHVEELDLACPGPLGDLKVDVLSATTNNSPGPDSQAPLRTGRLSGTVYLEGQAGRYAFDVFSLPLHLQGLAFGTYRIWYSSRVSSLLVPSPGRPDEYVTIGPTEARWELDLSDAGGLRFECLRPDGSRYAGRIHVMLLEGESIGPGWEGPMGYHSLDGPPHDLWPLRPGPVTFVLESPLPAESGFTTVHLVAGQVTRVSVTVK